MLQRAVLVHAGARDRYQVSRALYESDLLHRLVTNVYSGRVAARRYDQTVPRRLVHVDPYAFTLWLARRLTRSNAYLRISDKRLGRTARTIACRSGLPVFSYSYYASEAFRPGPDQPSHRVLFQLHPHPNTVRRILKEELELHPVAAHSLRQEHELRLGQSEIDELASEPELATSIIVASSFTAATLAENLTHTKQVKLVPYGVDTTRFHPLRARKRNDDRPLKVVFVGSVIQRKGIIYLLNAIRALSRTNIQLILRGRSVDANILDEYRDLRLDVAVNSSDANVIRTLQVADVFVMPSLVEGFCHAILEALACELPVIATPHTGAPDIILDGKHGFIVPIRDSDAIAEKLEWCAVNRKALRDLSEAAGQRSRQFSWARFRGGIRQAYVSMLRGVRLHP